jgi:tRNA pseudouridine38-40 synthase
MSAPCAPSATTEGILLTVAYDGTDFHGWARQTKQGVRTVEDAVLGAIQAMDPSVSLIRGASRTDAGVHANGQLAAFDTRRTIPSRGWVLGLNAHLPKDVAIRRAARVPAGFSPRFTAKAKRYCYGVRFDSVRHPRERHWTWQVHDPIDLSKVQTELTSIVGTHDFAGFRAVGDEREVTVRTIHEATLDRSTGATRIVIVGNAFLYNMVRILVGTVVDVGRGRLSPGAIARTLLSKDRADAGITAPAHGLTLDAIEFEDPAIFHDPWPRE